MSIELDTKLTTDQAQAIIDDCLAKYLFSHPSNRMGASGMGWMTEAVSSEVGSRYDSTELSELIRATMFPGIEPQA